MAEWGDFSKAVSDEFVMTGSDREKTGRDGSEPSAWIFECTLPRTFERERLVDYVVARS